MYLRTYPTEQSPSWEANRFSASQKFPRFLWKPKDHYRVQKGPPPVPILTQINPIRTHILLPKDSFYYYYTPIYVWVFHVFSFSQVSPPKPCLHFFSPLPSPYVLHALPILFYSILSTK